ncbi:MAG: hypothetical protein LBP35_01545 [Candidatus Ancillula trichonymphae]|jgi:hypothetical protein|nr:hypothetical protein [Candidatus Ancillula trichonymphae]
MKIMRKKICRVRYISLDIKTTGPDIVDDRITKICVVNRMKYKCKIEDEHKTWDVESSAAIEQCLLEFNDYICKQTARSTKLVLFDALVVLGVPEF